jgi:hypothetical protein
MLNLGRAPSTVDIVFKAVTVSLPYFVTNESRNYQSRIGAPQVRKQLRKLIAFECRILQQNICVQDYVHLFVSPSKADDHVIPVMPCLSSSSRPYSTRPSTPLHRYHHDTNQVAI